MRIGMLSDFHLSWNNPRSRKDNLVKVQFRKFAFILSSCDVLLQAGDFFDSPRSWYLLPQVMKILSKYQVPIFGVFGQHDTYMYSEATRETTNLGILEKAKLVTILDKNPVEFKNVVMYGCNWSEGIPRVKNPEKFNILVAHYPVAEKALFPNQDYIGAKRFLNHHKDYNIMLLGDIHQKYMFHSEKGNWLLNTGCVNRRKADEYNFTYKPGFYLFDTRSGMVDWIEVPHANAVEVLDRTKLDEERDMNYMMDDFVEGIKETEKGYNPKMDFKSNLDHFIQSHVLNNEVKEILFSLMAGGDV